MKCTICKKKIEMTFLGKIMGTYVMKGKKKNPICPECQQRDGEKIKEKI